MLTGLPLRPTLLVAFACLLVLGLQGWVEWKAYAAQVDETAAAMVNLATSLSQYAEAKIDIADTAVLSTVNLLETNGTSLASVALVQNVLSAEKIEFLHFRDVTVVDSDGNWLATSLPASQAVNMGNLSHRIYFRWHLDHPDAKPFLSPPIKSSVTGQWVMTVSRRFRSLSGEFGGIVFAVINLDDFVKRFAAYDLGHNGSIGIVETDGTMLARYPSNEQFIGRDMSKALVFRKVQEHPSGSYKAAAIVDGVERFSGYRLSDRYPLVVTASVAEEDALAAWSASARWDVAIAVVLVGAIGTLGLRLVRQMARNREGEERYHLLLQSGAVKQAVYMLDPSGQIESWNTAAQHIKGYTPEEIIGQNYAKFFPTDAVAAGEPDRALAMARKDGQFTADAWRVRKDGSRFLAHIVITPVWNDSGTLRGFAKVTEDITNQRIEQEQRAIIIEAAPNGMMIVDEADVITLANAQIARIFGYPEDGLVGEAVEVILPEGFRAAYGELRAAFTAGPSDPVMAPRRQFTGLRRDGSFVPIEIMLSPVETPRGAIAVVSVSDVTERLREESERLAAERDSRLAIEATNASLDRLSRHLAKARDRADQANRAKSRFLAGMSHELRTPLNGIMGYAQLLRLDGDLTPAQGARVDAMLAAGKHLIEMISCVLDLSEIEADHLQLRPSEFDLQAVAEACIDLIRPGAEAKGLSLGLVVAPGTRRKLVADPTRVRQVLINLLGNAAKFTNQGAIEVRLRTSDDGSVIRIEVADTGMGVPADQRERLYKDFERLDSEASRAAEGAGLGLALSARLAALMNGSIGHEDNPGGGSVFWLELPLDTVTTSQPILVAAAGGQDVRPADLPNRRLHVLVVDDMLMNRDIAACFLHAGGHEAVCAETGAEAVTAAANTDFDVVLMDVRMPGMDGLEATRRIRALDGARGQVPIVALTAQAFTDQMEACREAGMNNHLTKPFEMDALLTAVKEAADPARLPNAVSAVADIAGAAKSEIVKVEPVMRLIDPDLQVIDMVAFHRTAAFLAPGAVNSYLRTIANLGDTLLITLRESDALTRSVNELAEAAHALASSAGMFGFQRLATVGCRFEHAVQSGGSEISDLAEELCAAVEAAHHEIDIRGLIEGNPD